MLQLKKSGSGQWIHFFAYYPQDEEQSSHDFQIRVAMLWSRTVQNYTRWALIDLESFLYSSCSKLEKKTFLYVAAVISFISTANDLENPLHFDEKLLN